MASYEWENAVKTGATTGKLLDKKQNQNFFKGLPRATLISNNSTEGVFYFHEEHTPNIPCCLVNRTLTLDIQFLFSASTE